MNCSAAWPMVRPVFQPIEPFQLLDAVLEPGLAALVRRHAPVAVVARLELRVEAHGAVEDARGVRHARDHAASELARRVEDAGADALLEQVVDDLRRRAVPEQRLAALLGLAQVKGGPERDADVTDEPFVLRLLQLGPQRVVADGIEARVVQLVDVDVVRAEAPQRAFERLAHVGGRPVMRALLLALRLRVRVDVIAELRADDDAGRACRPGPRAG